MQINSLLNIDDQFYFYRKIQITVTIYRTFSDNSREIFGTYSSTISGYPGRNRELCRNMRSTYCDHYNYISIYTMQLETLMVGSYLTQLEYRITHARILFF